MASSESPKKENKTTKPTSLSSIMSSNSSSGSSPRARVPLSKEKNKNGQVAAGEASFRVYYGATGAAVPFVWESQPGTPKHPIFDKVNDNILPPLTPPPSYNSSMSPSRKASKPWTFSSLFSSSNPSSRRRTMSHVTPTSSLSLCSSSSSYSGHIRSWSTSSSSSSAASLSSPHLAGRKKYHQQQIIRHKRSASSSSFSCFSGQKSLLLEDFDEEDEKSGSRSPPSMMCFGFKKQGCYSMENVKNAVLSV